MPLTAPCFDLRVPLQADGGPDQRNGQSHTFVQLDEPQRGKSIAGHAVVFKLDVLYRSR